MRVTQDPTAARRGNLYVQVRVREHPFFVRDESDLLYRTSLNMAEAALGMTKPIPTLEGDDVDLEIPPGTQAGSEFRVRSRGVPRIRRDGRPTDRRGDIRVLVDVDIPSKLNKYQRKLVEDLAYSLANNGKRPPAPPRKKRADSRKPAQNETAEPEDAGVEAGAETQEPQPDDKQRGLFDRIKDTLTSSGRIACPFPKLDARCGAPRPDAEGAMSWHELSINVPFEYVEPVSYLFERYGYGLSVETRPGEHAVLRSYLPSLSRQRLAHIEVGIKLASSVADLGELEIRPLDDNEDWRHNWKQHFTLLRVGRNLVIKPSWIDYEAHSGDVLVELDPGLAFGTGYHPTTFPAWKLWKKWFEPAATCWTWERVPAS